MSNSVDAKSIIKVVDKLIGEIEPVGSEHIDRQRLNNLENHIKLLDVLIDDLCFLIDKRNDYRASVKDIGRKAYNSLKGLHESLGEVLEIENEGN